MKRKKKDFSFSLPFELYQNISSYQIEKFTYQSGEMINGIIFHIYVNTQLPEHFALPMPNITNTHALKNKTIFHPKKFIHKSLSRI